MPTTTGIRNAAAILAAAHTAKTARTISAVTVARWRRGRTGSGGLLIGLRAALRAAGLIRTWGGPARLDYPQHLALRRGVAIGGPASSCANGVWSRVVDSGRRRLRGLPDVSSSDANP